MTTNHLAAPQQTSQHSVARSPQAFTEEALSHFEATIEEFRLSLDYQSRVNAGKDEKVLLRHVESARTSMLATTMGKAIDIVTVWLLPIGFCLWGIAGSGFTQAFSGTPVHPGYVWVMLAGALSLGAAAALYFNSAYLKSWFASTGGKQRTPKPK